MAGIAAVSGERFDSLANIFLTKVPSLESPNKNVFLVENISDAIVNLTRDNAFKQLPGHENNHAPMSEYFLKLFQPKLDDILFLGKGYENSFDEFEVLLALVAADLSKQSGDNAWGPIGRFGYKSRNSSGGPLFRIIALARTQGQEWPPLKQGFFGGNIDRFNMVADEYANVIARIGWY